MTGHYHYAPVWDLTTRLWHWTLALSVITGWFLGEFRSFSTIEWHFYCGYLTGALVLFRYAWGFLGPQPIRFGTLFASTRHVFSYLRTIGRREPSGLEGHNPLGSLSVFALLLALTVQVTSGLFSEDDGLFSAGPLASEVAGSVVRQMTQIHHIGARVILVLVIMHLGAIAFYAIYKRENLVSAMINGRKLIRRQ